MELKNFTAETLKQIIEGVKAAQNDTKESGAIINPEPIGTPKNWMVDMESRVIKEIEFDVAVTTFEEKTKTEGVGVFVIGIGLGSKGESDIASSSMSRIKFSVPLVLPRPE